MARSIRDGIRSSKNWITENESESIRLASREFGVSRRVVRSAWRRFAFCAQLSDGTALDFKRDKEIMSRYGWLDSCQSESLDGFVRIIG